MGTMELWVYWLIGTSFAHYGQYGSIATGYALWVHWDRLCPLVTMDTIGPLGQARPTMDTMGPLGQDRPNMRTMGPWDRLGPLPSAHY